MRPSSDIQGYHVHIYYDDVKREEAATLRGAIESQFEVEMGRWRDEPVGPHPQAMYQVAFAPAVFETFVPWLMLNHGSLDVLIHPSTGDDLHDHRDLAMWLGNKLELNIGFLEQLAAR